MNQKTTCPRCKTTFEVSGDLFNTFVPCPSCTATFNPMQEYTKAAWEMTKTPEFQASLEADIAEANQGVTHADFVAGVQSGMLGFKCMRGEPSSLIAGTLKAIFNLLVLLYTVAPLFLVSGW